jgi:hypothetical protein
VRGDGGSSDHVSLRHHNLHLALEHFRPSAAHFGTSFLSSGVAKLASQRLLTGRNGQVQASSAGELKCRIVVCHRRTHGRSEFIYRILSKTQKNHP